MQRHCDRERPLGGLSTLNSFNDSDATAQLENYRTLLVGLPSVGFGPVTLDVLPEFIRENYEVHEWRHATAVLSADFPAEFDDLTFALSQFRLFRSEIEMPGGGRSNISARLDGYFRARGWAEKRFDTSFSVNGKVVEARGHKVDNFKNAIACDVEWNNKTEFYDRDLGNFARLHDIGALAVGIIITRASHLSEIFEKLGLTAAGKPFADKYGQSTTHLDKLVPKIHGGAAGGCPVLVFGIQRSLYVDDIADPSLFVEHPAPVGRKKKRSP
jgi:hypothetical protein